MLADGVRSAAEKLGRGSMEYAMQVKGLEIIQAEPRGMKGYALCFATATRGADHLRGEPFFEMSDDTEEGERRYGYPETALRMEEKGKGILLAEFQDWCGISDAMDVCKNSMVCMELLFMDEVHEYLNAITGFDYTPEEIREVAARIFAVEMAFNSRMGVRAEDNTLPQRFLNEPLPADSGPSAGQVVDLKPMLEEWYEARDYDPKTSMPSERLLRKLGLDDVARDLADLF